MDDRITNMIRWQKYLTKHNFGGNVWTEFEKANKKKKNETYTDYRKRLSEEYARSKNIKTPVMGKFDDIIERLDTIISKMNNQTFIPPALPVAPPMNLPPLPPPPPPMQKREPEKEFNIPKQHKVIDDTNEPVQVRLLNELKRKLEAREAKERKGSGIQSIHIPLSSDEIQNKVGCKFILYEDMKNVKDISELLPMTLILYQLADVGHFCCIFENDEGVNFFDPLGYMPDDELKLVREDVQNHDYTYLLRLLTKVNKRVIYNNYKLQSRNTSTCGHWCAVRMITRKMYCDEFAKCFKGCKNRDAVIAYIYNEI